MLRIMIIIITLIILSACSQKEELPSDLLICKYSKENGTITFFNNSKFENLKLSYPLIVTTNGHLATNLGSFGKNKGYVLAKTDSLILHVLKYKYTITSTEKVVIEEKDWNWYEERKFETSNYLSKSDVLKSITVFVTAYDDNHRKDELYNTKEIEIKL